MAFWTSLKNLWWGEEHGSGSVAVADLEPPTPNSADGESSTVIDEETEAVSDAPAEDAIRPWWQPVGTLVTEWPPVGNPANCGPNGENEAAVLASLDARLDDSNIELPHLPQIPQQVLVLVVLGVVVIIGGQ